MAAQWRPRIGSIRRSPCDSMPPFDTFFHIPELDPAVRKSFRREQLSELTLPRRLVLGALKRYVLTVRAALAQSGGRLSV